MKVISKIEAMAFLAAVASLTSCQNSYDAPELDNPVATMEANTTIAEFKELFGDELAVEVPYKDEEKQIPYIIKGHVVNNDASGNIYRMLVVQDETAALAFSINRGQLYTNYPCGQEVVINLTDLWAGQYNALIQVGQLGDYQGQPQISFMPFVKFQSHTQLSGQPDREFQFVRFGKEAPADKPYIISATLEEINSIAGAGKQYRNMMSQLVEIPNVSFVDGGKENYAPYQDNADRYIQDARGNQLIVRNSGYSSFYNEMLPTGTGSVRGILSRYGDKWQLVLRDLGDVIFDGQGTKSDPYTCEEVIGFNNNGKTAWAEGYIVGSVRSGVKGDEATADDIIYGAASTELDNNVVIAPEMDCKDFEKLVVVELPAGTKLREYANLLDNPNVLGYKLLVRGKLSEWLGMHAIKDCDGTVVDFEIVGYDIPGVTGQGSGTEDSPYTVDFIIDNPVAQDDAWVEGYIVGFISGANMATGAKFTSSTAGADYSGNNVIIAASASANSPSQCIPVSLSGESREMFGLKANPGVYKKKVKIRGSIGKTFGAIGVDFVSSMFEVK